MRSCGECYHAGYCYTLREWYCNKWNRFLGYSLKPYKCTACDVIGEGGDVREIRAMFEFLDGQA